MKNSFYTAIFCLTLSACSQKQNADLLVYNATIYTIDSGFSMAEAMVIKDGKIIETGIASRLQDRYEAKEKMDAQGKFIYPGLIDAHAHFSGYGSSLLRVNLA